MKKELVYVMMRTGYIGTLSEVERSEDEREKAGQ